MRLLLSVIVIDTVRNIIENLYFGLYFGAQYGLLPTAIVGVLGNPVYLILPKVMNVVAACAVLGLLVLRWLPQASKDRADVDADLHEKTEPLNREAEERRRLFETSLDLIFVTDRKGTFTRVSPSSLPIMGDGPEEMIGHSGGEFIYADDLEATRREMQLARKGQETRNFESRYVHKNGRIVPLTWSGVWSEPEQKHFFFGRDMTERKAAEEQLHRLAHFDQLTGLPNRRAWEEGLDRELARAAREGHELCVAVIDLDDFKQYNDAHGHQAGDAMLRRTADAWRSCVRASDLLARYGGEEFAAVIPAWPLEAALTVVERLRTAMPEEQTCSAGVAIWNRAESAAELFARADAALYAAKQAGRNRTLSAG